MLQNISLQNISYSTSNKNSTGYNEKYVREAIAKTNIVNEDLIQILLARSNQKSLAGSPREIDFLNKTNYTFYYTSPATLYIANFSLCPLGIFINEKEYIERFFREYLGVVAEVSRLRIVIPTFGVGVVSMVNIIYIMQTLTAVLNKTVFKKYFEYKNYEEFCENLLLNISELPLYGTRRELFVVLYCILFLKDFTARDLVVSETSTSGCTFYRGKSTDSLISYFRGLLPNERKYLKNLVSKNKEYLQSIMDKYLPKATVTNTKRAATAAETWMLLNM